MKRERHVKRERDVRRERQARRVTSKKIVSEVFVCCAMLCCVVSLCDVLWLGCACCCGRGCGCVSVRVSFLPALKNAPLCTFKSLPCVPSKRPCYIKHRRFESTHGNVLNVHTGVSLAVSLSRPSLSSHASLSLSSSVSVLNDDDTDHSFSWLSLYAQP